MILKGGDKSGDDSKLSFPSSEDPDQISELDNIVHDSAFHVQPNARIRFLNNFDEFVTSNIQEAGRPTNQEKKKGARRISSNNPSRFYHLQEIQHNRAQ